MVTYEYRCESCGRTFEQQEHLNEHGSTPTHCPDCRSEKVEQMHSAAAFVKTSKKS